MLAQVLWTRGCNNRFLGCRDSRGRCNRDKPNQQQLYPTIELGLGQMRRTNPSIGSNINTTHSSLHSQQQASSHLASRLPSYSHLPSQLFINTGANIFAQQPSHSSPCDSPSLLQRSAQHSLHPPLTVPPSLLHPITATTCLTISTSSLHCLCQCVLLVQRGATPSRRSISRGADMRRRNRWGTETGLDSASELVPVRAPATVSLASATVPSTSVTVPSAPHALQAAAVPSSLLPFWMRMRTAAPRFRRPRQSL